MIQRDQLTHYLADYLQIQAFKDYCPNGLQVQGKPEVKKIITGVTACQELIEQAISANADGILVHHGYFWKGENPTLTGMKYQRIKRLLDHDINLWAYHLPLDVHESVGNNVQLAKMLGLKNITPFDTQTTPSYGIIGQIQPQSVPEILVTLNQGLNRRPLLVGPDDQLIRRVAICTGGAPDFIQAAYEAGADLYISGEIAERTTHQARELPITYLAAGHHATERGGVIALGQHLSQQFDISCTFVDIDNPA